MLERRGDERDMGVEHEVLDDGSLHVIAVTSRGLAAKWNDYCCADEAILPNDVIISVNDVRGDAAAMVAQFCEQNVLLVLRRSPSPLVKQVFEATVPELPPDEKKTLRAIVRSFDECALVCCRCRHATYKQRKGKLYTHGEWALWHLDRCHKGDHRLLQGLWSQVAFPMHCELAAEISKEAGGRLSVGREWADE